MDFATSLALNIHYLPFTAMNFMNKNSISSWSIVLLLRSMLCPLAEFPRFSRQEKHTLIEEMLHGYDCTLLFEYFVLQFVLPCMISNAR
jgi:hypothetical protein